MLFNTSLQSLKTLYRCHRVAAVLLSGTNYYATSHLHRPYELSREDSPFHPFFYRLSAVQVK